MQGSRAGGLCRCWLGVLVCCLAWPLWAQAESEGLRLAVLSFRPKPVTQAQWQPTATYLGRALGRPVTVLPMTYEELESALANQQADLVLTNPGHYILMSHRFGLQRVATQVDQGEGLAAKTLGGVIVTASGRGDAIATVKDLKGRIIAIPETTSLGGFQAQAGVLAEAGIRLPGDARLLVTEVPHDRAVEAVLEGRADAAFVRSGVLEAMVREKKLTLDRIRVINPVSVEGFPFALSTPLYPNWPFAVMPHVEESLAKQVTVALLALPAGHEAAAAARYRGWAVGTDYEPVRALLETLRLPPYDHRAAISLKAVLHSYGPQLLVGGTVGLAVLLLLVLSLSRLNGRLKEALAAKEKHLQALDAEHRLFATGPVAVLVWRKQEGWPLSYASPNAGALLGVAQGQLLESGGAYLDLIHPDDRLGVEQVMATHLAENHDCWDMHYRVRAEGGTRALYQYVAVERGDSGEVTALRGYVLDETQIHDAMSRIRLLASVFEQAQEGIIITDPLSRILEVNPAFMAVTGYTREEALGQTPAMLRSGRHDETFYKALWEAVNSKGYWHGEIWNRRKTGEIYPQMLTISAMKDSEGQVSHYIAIFFDITTLKQQQARLELLAHFDPLTEVPNRVLLGDRLAQACAQTRRAEALLAVCYLDLDHFKPVNDTYGHQAGDTLLIVMAKRLTHCLRSGDTVARLGGDEFVLLLPELDSTEELNVAMNRVLETVARPVKIGEASVQVGASIGVSLFPQEDVDPDTLLRHADQALYVAKQSGRNRYHIFDNRAEQSARSTFETRARIGKALEEEEFCLHYQPKANLRRGTVEGVEALIRWNHPERGLVPPGEFLPMIEGSALEVQISKWVMRQALAQIRAWQAQGLDLGVSVNLPASHLKDEEFVTFLNACLGEFHDVAPDRLELEILETAAIGDIDGISQKMEACRRFGVSFALDDFGTGYASLAYLRRLPIDLLKIDQSFVRDMLLDPDDLAIVEGVIGLATAFQDRVIAEGVETLAHGMMLLYLGCELAQGYGIARPMPAEKIPDWVAHWKPDQDLHLALKGGLSRQDLILVMMEVEQRRWVDGILACLNCEQLGEMHAPPLDSTRCRFGQWMTTRGQATYGHLPEFIAMDPDHEAMHDLGRRMIELCSAGQRQEALALAPQLMELRDRLVNSLHRLMGAVLNTPPAS